jgi:hypothetical protein
MRQYEYVIHETEFRKEMPEMLAMYFDQRGKNSWKLIFLQPLQTIDASNVMLPGGVPKIKISFLCIFIRRKSWIRKLLFRLKRNQ